MADYEVLPGGVRVIGVQGDDIRIPYDFSISLTGYTLTAAVTTNKGETVALTIDGATASTGVGIVVITDTQSAALAVGTHQWHLRWSDTDGNVRTALAGELIIYPRGYIAE